MGSVLGAQINTPKTGGGSRVPLFLTTFSPVVKALTQVQFPLLPEVEKGFELASPTS